MSAYPAQEKVTNTVIVSLLLTRWQSQAYGSVPCHKVRIPRGRIDATQVVLGRNATTGAVDRSRVHDAQNVSITIVDYSFVGAVAYGMSWAAVEAVGKLVPVDAHEETTVRFHRCESINSDLFVKLQPDRNDVHRGVSVR